jgi:hypothetical protein
VTFTAIPPIASSNLSFTYPAVPSGLGFTDSSGNPVNGYPFYPSDNKIVLAGTPTAATPTLGTQSITVPLRANVTSVFSGNLSNTTTLTFNYTETVVFTTPSNNVVFSNAFVGLPITRIPFNAVSYFGAGSSIGSLSSPNLRSDLSLNSTSGVADLSGTPTFAGSNTFLATAVSSTGVTGSINFTFVSQNDVLTLSPFVDASLSFIIGRPLANPLAGYYSSNLTLTANSSAGQPITFVTEGFAQGGIGVTSNVTSNGTTITFSGVPTTLVPRTDGIVTATDGILSATQTVPFAVLDDVFTWSVVTPNFLQNQTITPIQISATTLSGRVLISYTASGLPSGLFMSRTGLITGTCYNSSGGTFVVTGSTGISTQPHVYTYNVTPDTLLLSAPAASYSLVPGQVIPPIDLSALLSSGATPSTFSLSGETYGLTVTPTGVIGGTLYSGQPPNLLVPTANITVNVRVGTTFVPTSITLTSSAFLVFGQLLLAGNSLYIVYEYTTNFPDLFAGIPNLLGTGAPQINATTGVVGNLEAASDIKVNSSGRYVASLSGVDSAGTTLIGSVLAGNVGTTTAPTNIVLTTSGGGARTLYRSAFSVACSGSGSIWYALGVGLNITDGPSYANHVYLLKSNDNGETWTLGYVTTVAREPRNWALAVNPDFTYSNPFTDWTDDFLYATRDRYAQPVGSVVLRYSPATGIYMAGGGSGPGVEYSALRITSMTAAPPSFREREATLVPAWTAVNPATGGFEVETRDFAIDVPAGTPWIAAGSSAYYALSSVKVFPAYTLRWSLDNGLSWNACTNDYTFSATVVTYGGGRWMALGSDNSYIYYAKSSTDGFVWTDVVLPNEAALLFGTTIVYSNSTWMVFGNGELLFYNTSPALNPASWVSTRLTLNVTRASVGFSTINPYAVNSVLAISAVDPTIQLVSPANTAYAIMQYTFMQPIVLVLNRSPAYFFLTNDGLPNGIRFDAGTGTFSGMPMATGNYSVRITVKSTSPAYNYFDFTFRIYSPYPQKRQDTASAFTSYVRQEAIIGGAQFSRDSNAFPSENTTVGAAMGPFPPEIEQAPKPCCIPLPSVKN